MFGKVEEEDVKDAGLVKNVVLPEGGDVVLLEE